MKRWIYKFSFLYKYQGIKSIIFLLVSIIPIVAFSQAVLQDSTINHSGEKPLTSINQSNQNELSTLYFSVLDKTDSLLQDYRLRDSIRAFTKSKAALTRPRRFITEYAFDSTGMTYYFPVNNGSANSYSLYFRKPSDFVPWPALKRTTNGNIIPPLISLHGNFYYEFLYRSRIDTPFATSNFQQHIEQLYADMVYKGKYPFRVILTARQSNFAYFKSYVDANIQFNQFAYRRNIKDKILGDVENRINTSGKKKEVEDLLKSQVTQFDSLRSWVDHPGRMQEIIEEKEKRVPEYLQLQTFKKRAEDSLRILLNDKDISGQFLPPDQKKNLDSLSGEYNRAINDTLKAYKTIDSLKAFILKTSNLEEMKKWVQVVDSLQSALAGGRKKADSLKAITAMISSPQNIRRMLIDSLQSRVNKIDSAANSMIAAPTDAEKKLIEKRKELEKLTGNIKKYQSLSDSLRVTEAKEISALASQLNNAKSPKEVNEIIKSKNATPLDKKSQLLLSVKQFGVGKSVLDYSELTVKNISLTGLNVEYKNNFYAALAVGKIDYRFKDFIVDPPGNKQSLLLARYGWLPGKNKSIIFTAYSGTKQNYSVEPIVQPATEIRPMHIMGYGLELNYTFNPNIDFTAEVVKSSVPYRGGNANGAIHKAFAFNDRGNEAWSCKMNLSFPLLQSTIKGFYKKVGMEFQSYSIFNTGSQQESWGLRWQQYIWKKQLSFTGQIKKNDFDNPFLNLNYKSTSVLKSIQGVFRKRKWPIISAAYMPTTQLTKAPGGILTENIFYSFNASVSHSYRRRKTFMNTSFFYNKFYTRGTDSGFVFFGAESARLNQDMQLSKFGSHSALEFYTQPGLKYYTLSENIDVVVSPAFSLGLGGKKAILKDGGAYLGGSAKASLQIKKLGTLQVQYEKEFLPDYARSGLTAIDWGRIIWTKTF